MIEYVKDNDATKIIEMGNQTTSIKNPRCPDDVKSFTYDYSYCSFDPSDKSFANQNTVYKDLGDEMTEHAFQG